jgi:hypothetical protein
MFGNVPLLSSSSSSSNFSLLSFIVVDVVVG